MLFTRWWRRKFTLSQTPSNSTFIHSDVDWFYCLVFNRCLASFAWCAFCSTLYLLFVLSNTDWRRERTLEPCTTHTHTLSQTDVYLPYIDDGIFSTNLICYQLNTFIVLQVKKQTQRVALFSPNDPNRICICHSFPFLP